MSFADPLALTALLALPALAIIYALAQRRRARQAAAFTAPELTESVAPERPRWRRHAPMVAFALSLAILIGAAAHPQKAVTRPLTNGAVMLVDDVSGSMQATDVAPTRERAAREAGARFIANVPSGIDVGVLAFARAPELLQSPTADHQQALAALARPPHFGGGTAIGQAILAAAQQIHALPKVAGRHVPGAIVLISDGASNVGVDPLQAAREAKALHIPVYTVSVGTPYGTIKIPRRSGTVTAAVPVSRRQLAQIAAASGGRAFTASDASGVDAAYQHLAASLGHRRTQQEMTAAFAGGGLLLLVLGAAMSLRWFGRLI